MTNYGMAAQLYSQYIEPRPYSRFTALDHEQQANDDWSMRVRDWAKMYMNEAGGLNQAGVNLYVLHTDGGKALQARDEWWMA